MQPENPRVWLTRLRHDLRTPLNAIIGYSEMLLEELDGKPKPVVAELEVVRNLGRELLALIAEVLATPPEGTVLPELSLRGQTLHCLLESPIGLLQRAAPALLESAVKQGMLELLPDFERIGLAVMQLESMLFALGNQASDSSSKSDTGEGAAAGLAATPGVPGSPAQSPAPAGRILIVDDNVLNRDLLKRRLEKDGHSTVAASGGEEALKALGAGCLDLMLLDLMMPGMSGDQVLDRVKADPELRKIPVIMLSSLDEASAAVACIGRGAEDYLPKPFDPVILRARIGASLEKKRLREKEAEYLRQLEIERDRSNALLRTILRTDIAREFDAGDPVRPEQVAPAAILFSSLAGFPPASANRPPDGTLSLLQSLTVELERISASFHLRKLETMGTSFMAAAGLVRSLEHPALPCVRAAFQMIAAARRLAPGGEIRVGIQAGPIVTGTVRGKTYLFDVWGDTVHAACRVESTALPGTVNVAREAWDDISSVFGGACRGKLELEGKGSTEVFHVLELQERMPVS